MTEQELQRLRIYYKTKITQNYKQRIQEKDSDLKRSIGMSLVAQWLRIRLPMQGTRV